MCFILLVIVVLALLAYLALPVMGVYLLIEQ
jgi:hypothetical protein